MLMLVDLLEDANQSDSIPAWLQGMSYISRARDLEEDLVINEMQFTPLCINGHTRRVYPHSSNDNRSSQ